MAVKLLILLIAASQLWCEAAAECKCFNQWGSLERRKHSAFTSKPELKRYQYTGVFVGLNGAYYKPCVCDDVVRAEATLTIESTSLYKMAMNPNTTSDAELNVTETLLDLKRSMEEDTSYRSSLYFRIETYYAKVETKQAPDTVTFALEVVLRGFNETGQDVKLALEEVISNNNSTANHALPYLGPYTLTNFTEVKCAEDPPDSPTEVGMKPREWSGVRYPPAKAYYTCADGQYAYPHGEGVSTCQHDTKTWTKLNPELKCEDGCKDDPPDPPLNSTSNWDRSNRTIGCHITYECQPGYGSGDGSGANSTCTEDGVWTPLPSTYFCTEKACLDPIPQVPSHAVSNFHEERRSAGTVVTYTCIPGFRSPNETDMTVTCSRGNWSRPTTGWSCTNIYSMNLADILKGEMDIPDDELTEEEKQRKLDMATENYYFWIVTIPSIIGLALAMLVCLCCTRTDSPLFNLCGGRKKNPFNYEDYKKRQGYN